MSFGGSGQPITVTFILTWHVFMVLLGKQVNKKKNLSITKKGRFTVEKMKDFLYFDSPF